MAVSQCLIMCPACSRHSVKYFLTDWLNEWTNKKKALKIIKVKKIIIIKVLNYIWKDIITKLMLIRELNTMTPSIYDNSI